MIQQGMIAASARPEESGEWQRVTAPCGDAAEVVAGLDRASRLPNFIDAPQDAAKRLEKLGVAVVGSGSVGMGAIAEFARLGIRGLWICDPKSTKAESVLTHPIAPEQVGQPKAELAARHAKAISPATEVCFFPGPLQAMRRDALRGADFVLIATDNLAAELAATQVCMHLGLPHIQASVHGGSLVVQVRALVSEEGGSGACLACGFSSRDFSDLDANTRFSCAGEQSAGGRDVGASPSIVPTRSPAHLCSLAASLAVGELIQRYLGLGDPAPPSRCLEYCGYHGRTVSLRLERNDSCPIDHDRWAICTTDAELAALTPRDLILLAGHSVSELTMLAFSLEGYRFVSMTACACGGHAQLRQFLPRGGMLGPCASCGSPHLVPHPLHTFANVPGAALAADLDRTLGDLGGTSTPTVLVRGVHGATLVCSVGATVPPPSAHYGVTP